MAAERSDVERIHETSLRVLERVGVDVGLKRVRDGLLREGAREGATGDRLLLPRELVAEALGRCVRRFELKTVMGESLPMGEGRRHFSSCVVDPFLYGPDGMRRPPRLADCLFHSRLVDAVGLVGMPYKMDLAYADAEGEEALYLSNYAFLANVGRHCTFAPHGVREARVWLEMLEIVSGGSMERARTASALVSPISPLTLDASFLELVCFLAPAGIPLVLLPCPMAGATAPISLAGTAAVFHAENLASIAAIQTLFPGTPLLYDSVGSAFSMSAGSASLGGPEKILLGRMGVALGRFLGLPCGIAGVSTDSRRFDRRNGAQSMSQLLLALSAGADVVYGLGSMDNGNGTSAGQILFDCGLVRLADYLLGGIRVDEERLAFASIAAVGPGGDFLTDRLTLDLLRGGELFGGLDEDLEERAAVLVRGHRSRIPESRRDGLRRYVEARTRRPLPE